VNYVDYCPRGAAREIFSRREPEVVLSGPAGTGKSRAVLEKLNALCEKYAGCRILMVRKTRASLTTTGIITYTNNVLPPSCGVHVNHEQAVYPNGSVVVFGGMDKSSKIMSSEYDVAYVQEATELTEADWEDITTRLRWGRIPYQQILADCNPGAPTHWLRRRAQSGRLVMIESRHQDNPYLWDGKASKWTKVGAEYIAKLDALTGVRRARLYLGQWAAAEGLVYESFDAAAHLVQRFEVPASWPRIWVLDFGYTNPFVWQAWARDHDGRMYRYAEIYRTRRLVEDHEKDIRAYCARHNEPRPVAIVCDHDAEDRATFERHMGLETVAAYKSISPGVQAVQQRLRPAGDGRPRLVFLRDSLLEADQALLDARKPTCTEQEIEAYCWPTSTSGVVKDTPVKRDDHGMDAMRYLVAFADGIADDPQEVTMRGQYVSDHEYQISPY
jgi:PBSX family phage terminase large subunit